MMLEMGKTATAPKAAFSGLEWQDFEALQREMT
jgi:hypothetical protein